ncbi:AAA family ATPase [Halomonas sp. ANAO-440]|uniref:AAA family ATPase n=1 Tax=Halomonas sp. ANAO-440 TaxID=2861360 RepID=UPI001CAA6B72|nr:AAA family ATPase [Halomonas sp. ANAO-440]MBZ0330027.1 AAA family ATPase [Halomonas sp. ANAO-440]
MADLPMPEHLQKMRDAAEKREQELIKLRDTESRTEGLKAAAEMEKAALEKEKIRAQRASGAVMPRPADPDSIILEVAMSGDSTTKLEYLIDPWLPRKQVIGFYGRGGTAKSSFVATLAAQMSEYASTLWVSTEELSDWIRVRHTKAGGIDATLLVVKAVVTKTDMTGKPIASTFNTYEHLDAAIIQAKQHADAIHDQELPRPLRFVVLDTAVALTTWGASESPNSDAGVKRLMAYLQSLCEKHGVTIAVIGHSNKGKHDDLSDSVAGSGAWVNSPRQAFIHLNDKRAKNHFVVCTVKHSLTGFFATTYSTIPIHTLATRAEGNDTVLCKVDAWPIEWDYQHARMMIDAARGEDDQSNGSGCTRTANKQKNISAIITTVLELLDEGGKVDRKAVHDRLGYEPSRRHWIDADNGLAVTHTVFATPGEHGRLYYQRN